MNLGDSNAPAPPEPSTPRDEQHDPLLREVRLRSLRQRISDEQGEPSVARRLARIGVLGWIIVTPVLLGVFLGRWIDLRYDSGLYATGPLLMIGLGVGCWSAWKWMGTE